MAKPKLVGNPTGAPIGADTFENLKWDESASGESLVARFVHPDTGKDSMFIVLKRTYGDKKTGIIKPSVLSSLFAGPNRPGTVLTGEDKDTGEVYEIDTYWPDRSRKTVAETAPVAFGASAAPREKPVYQQVPPRQTI